MPSLSTDATALLSLATDVEPPPTTGLVPTPGERHSERSKGMVLGGPSGLEAVAGVVGTADPDTVVVFSVTSSGSSITSPPSGLLISLRGLIGGGGDGGVVFVGLGVGLMILSIGMVVTTAV